MDLDHGVIMASWREKKKIQKKREREKKDATRAINYKKEKKERLDSVKKDQLSIMEMSGCEHNTLGYREDIKIKDT